MKTIKYILIIALLAVVDGMLQSCTPTQLLQQTTMKDTTYVERIINHRDTVFYTKEHHVFDTIKNPCPDATPAFKDVLKTDKKATLKASVVNKNIVVECDCDTNVIRAQLKDVYEKRFREISKSSTQTIIKNEKYIPWYVKCFAWFGVICFLGLIAFIIIKIYKP